MFIKSIHIDGFKSYGKRVEIDGFDNKFNAITGLNGSGKSNILDAICFVLGISNLTHVRVNSLQELIFKNGQAGINTATVTIIFDNSEKSESPTGYENFKEITITRQVVMGGKNKYWINSCVVPNKKVHDFFCSVQMNINNPHFIIMQGRVTKVLNMKAHEILAMLEEAAGTRMYETKKQATLKTIEKKTAKMNEIDTIVTEEINPRLEKLRRERQSFVDYSNIERQLVSMKKLYEAFLFFASKRLADASLQKLEQAENDVKKIQDNIEENLKSIEEINVQLAQIQEAEDDNGEIAELESNVKEKEKFNAKSSVTIKAVRDEVKNEERKLKSTQKNITDDGALLKTKENELSKVEGLFETLKQNDEKDTAAYNLAQKKYEAICAGMEINEDGEAQSLQEQLIAMKEEASAKNTEIKTATSQLSHIDAEVKKKEALIGTAGADYQNAKANYEHVKSDVNKLEAQAAKLNYSDDAVVSLKQQHQKLTHDLRQHRDKVENFEARRPFTKFNYRDPAPNFDRRQVHGVVCRLIRVKDPKYCVALETAAGGKLYNVICKNEQVSKLLLQHGQLQQRTTFLPLNKIQGGRIPAKAIRCAQELVGRENAIPALELIEYDPQLQPAMEFIFGQAFICTDMNVAKKVTFHPQIRRKCVTLDGDVSDPSGTLSGGARQKTAPVLLQIGEILEAEDILKHGDRELQQVDTELGLKLQGQEQFQYLQQRLDIKRTELANMEKILQQTSHHQNVQEVQEMKEQIGQLRQKVSDARQAEKEALAKIKTIQGNLKDADGHRERTLKAAETDMKQAMSQADKSKKEWQKREAEYEALKLEISELKTSLESMQSQIVTTEEEIERLKSEADQLESDFTGHKDELSALQARLKSEKAAIASKNREISKKNDQKEKLQTQINDFKLEIQKQEHTIGKYREEHKKAKGREAECEKRASKIDKNVMKDASELSDKDGNILQTKITKLEEDRVKLGRNINVNAQKMFDHEEKQHSVLMKRKRIIETDQIKLDQMLKDLDRQKEEAVKLAYNQVKRDFGSIFSTLLPGANATLAPPQRKTIVDGLEIKVSLGGIWKDNLTELSGGQRSLAALSLILAMLLFKPAPLYILDEVDAALDLSHTQNIGTMLKNHFKQSQFVVVSLKDGMFSNANVLFRTKFIDGVSAVSRTVNKA